MAKTLSTVGLDGVVNMTESPTGFSRFAMVTGMVIERGFVDSLFVETLDAADENNKDAIMGNFMELEQPFVLVVADAISEIS